MKLKSLLIVIAVALLVVPACAGSAAPSSAPGVTGPSNITDGVMTTSVDEGSKPTGGVKTTFPPDTAAIYCSFRVSGVAQEDMIKATWVYVNGEASDQTNTVLNETYDIVQSAEASYYLAFYFDKPAGGWRKGDYKVVLSINNKEKLSVPFKVG
jgi:hypothetical protein